MAISGTTLARFQVADTQPVGFTTVRFAPELQHGITWQDGAGASAIQDIGTKVHTLTGGSDSIDLNSGFANLLGAAIAFTGVKALFLVAPASNAGDVTVSFGGTNEWDAALTGDLILKPGSSLMLQTQAAAAYAITAGTADLIGVAGTADDVLHIALGGVAS